MPVRHSHHLATRLHTEVRMLVPMMNGQRMEVRKETQFKNLAETVNVQTLTQVSVIVTETVA